MVSKLFDVENVMEMNEVRNVVEKEELVILGEELCCREEALEAYVEVARVTERVMMS